jgi:hypothetical protein
MPKKTCKWTYDNDYDQWITSCDNAFVLMEGTPAENRMLYCPYCGKNITQDKVIKDVPH